MSTTAGDATIEVASRASDPASTARTLATAGRCLAQIERDMDRAEGMLLEAQAIAVNLGIDVPDIPIGLGIVHHHRGNDDVATDLFELGLSTAMRTLNHWIACDCLTRLAMLELELGCPERALARCVVLLPMAGKMGEGSEAPFGAALQALADLELGRPDATAAVEASVVRLRAIDTKGHLAYVQNSVAAIELRAGLLGPAQVRAEEALSAAETVDRPNEIARARAHLATIAGRRGEHALAALHLAAIAEHVARPLGISSRVRAAVSRAANEIGALFPTETPTQAQPPRSDAWSPP